jgi:hypothetical protein
MERVVKRSAFVSSTAALCLVTSLAAATAASASATATDATLTPDDVVAAVQQAASLPDAGPVRQQFDCHAFGNAFAGPWNLERYRPNRTGVWTYGVGSHHCNWNTADKL